MSINSAVAHFETFFSVCLKAHPKIAPPPPLYKPTQNPLQTCISPGLISGMVTVCICSKLKTAENRLFLQKKSGRILKYVVKQSFQSRLVDLR